MDAGLGAEPCPLSLIEAVICPPKVLSRAKIEQRGSEFQCSLTGSLKILLPPLASFVNETGNYPKRAVYRRTRRSLLGKPHHNCIGPQRAGPLEGVRRAVLGESSLGDLGDLGDSN